MRAAHAAFASIRPARQEDAPQLKAIAEEAYAPYVAAIGKRPAPMDADFAAHVRAGEAFVASPPAGSVLGYVILIDQSGMLAVENVAVADAVRGQGVGRTLMEFAEQEGRRRGSSALTLYTNAKMTANVALYARAGYVPTGRAEQDGFDRVFFRKELHSR